MKPNNDEEDLKLIPGYMNALVGNLTVDSMKVLCAYHGTNITSPEDFLRLSGLPARGTDTDLIKHVEPPAGHSQNSAFRGTVPYPVYPAVEGPSCAAEWADLGGWVYEVSNWRGYDINTVLEGRIPNGKGGYRGPLMKGENETAISARVPARYISRIGQVNKGRGNRLVVDWS